MKRESNGSPLFYFDSRGYGPNLSRYSAEFMKPLTIDRKSVGAYFVRTAKVPLSIKVVSLENGNTLHTFPIAGENIESLKIVWPLDARSLNYIALIGGQTSMWKQALNEAEPQLIASLGSDEISAIALSPDGRNLAYVRGRWFHDAVLIGGLK